MAFSKHVTLTAATVATVTLDADFNNVEVVNVDGTAAVYFTLDGDDPTVAGDDTYVLPAAVGSVEMPVHNWSAATSVKLISSGTPKVAVRGW